MIQAPQKLFSAWAKNSGQGEDPVPDGSPLNIKLGLLGGKISLSDYDYVSW